MYTKIHHIWEELSEVLRLVGLMNMKVSDFTGDRIRIIGKFGKYRYLYYTSDTPRVLDRWILEREKALEKAGNVKDPGDLFIHYWAGQIRPMSKSTYYNKIISFSKRIESEFRFHTLRRTFGRNARKQNIDISVIQAIYGHSKITTTGVYIRASEEEIKTALQQLNTIKNVKFNRIVSEIEEE